VGRSLGRLVGKKIIEKYPYLKEVHGFHMNDFGLVAAASLAHDIEPALDIQVKSDRRVFFHWKWKKYQDKLSKAMAGFNRF
jgi:dGTPase